jgi:hypothetical protein
MAAMILGLNLVAFSNTTYQTTIHKETIFGKLVAKSAILASYFFYLIIL